MKEDKHNVRVTFIHGNGINIDAKGCGQIYLVPNHDYFFENAPMQFINYLAQLKRLGITYRLTNDKRGCYQTFNLIGYYANDPFTNLNKLRTNKAASNVVVHDLPEQEVFKKEEPVIPDETPSSILGNDDSSEELKEVFSGNVESTPKDDTEQTADDSTEEVTDNTDEEITDEESTTESEPVDIERLSKPELIKYAHDLGLSSVTDYWTKKEIKEAITKASN